MRLTSTQMGALKATGNNTLTTYVNGQKVPGNPASLRLASHQQITLVYAPAGQQIEVPDSYDFAVFPHVSALAPRTPEELRVPA